MIKLMHLDCYRASILEGFALSVGGLSETLVRNSSVLLVDFVCSLNKSNGKENGRIGNSVFMESLLNVFGLNIKNDRVSNSLLETLYVLFCGGAFEDSCPSFLDQLDVLYTLIKREVLKSKDVKKLTSAIQV